MKLSTREREGVLICDIRGHLLSGPHAGEFLRVVEDSLRAGGRRILVNLAQVKWIDGNGLGTLIMAYKRVRLAGGTLKLMQVNDRIRSILEITHLGPLFDLCADESEALYRFESGRFEAGPAFALSKGRGLAAAGGLQTGGDPS